MIVLAEGGGGMTRVAGRLGEIRRHAAGDIGFVLQSSAHRIDLLNAREFAELYVDGYNNSYHAYCNKAGVEYNPNDDNATRILKTGKYGATLAIVGLSPYFWDFNTGTYAETAFMYDPDWQR